jgi:hypothetical protein
MVAKVADVVSNHTWTLPDVFRQHYPAIANDIQATTLSCTQEQDELV